MWPFPKRIPKNITFNFGGELWDGGTLILYGKASNGRQHEVRINQRMFSGRRGKPGRLCFDGRLVKPRSQLERQILELLHRSGIDTSDSPCSDKKVKRVLGRIIGFVGSEDYLKHMQQ